MLPEFFQITAVCLNRRIALLGIVLFLNNSLNAQVPVIPSCENCLDSLVRTYWNPPDSLAKYVRDTVKKNFVYSSANKGEALVFVGNPEHSAIRVNGKDHFGGLHQPKQKLSDNRRFFIPVQVNKGKNVIEITSTSSTDHTFFFTPTVITDANKHDVEQIFTSNNNWAHIVFIIVLSVAAVLFIYSLFHYVIYRSNEYLHYGLYVGYVFLFNLYGFDWFSDVHILFPENPAYYTFIEDFAQQVMFFLYVNFVIHFLELERVDRVSYVSARVLQYALLAVSLFISIYNSVTQNVSIIAEQLSFLYLPPFLLSLYVAYRIWTRGQTYLRHYILIGGLIVSIANLIQLGFSTVEYQGYYRNYFVQSSGGLYGFSVLQVAILIELLFFLLAISLRTRDKEYQLIGLKNTTIRQLEENRKLEIQVKELLQDKLSQSEEALEIEKLNSEKQKTESNLLKAQLKSLQLQMNPHYLFNSLNSINDFIISQNPMEASEYLALYARMMRNVLKNSDKMFNTLNEELNFCADYLELEQLRFGNKFSFRIERPRNPKQLQVKIPAMLLQPVLENAVWHGMMHLKSKGEIVLDASKLTAKRTIIRITDNGNGLKVAEEKSANKQSYGIRNIKEKMILIEKMYGESTRFEINNRTDSTGVEVLFEFPVFVDTINEEPELNIDNA